MPELAELPSYRDLLARTDAPAGSSWNVFGEGDQLGALGFIGPEQAVHAASLVRTGRVFDLDYPINAFVPSIAGTRPATEHRIFANNPNHRDDWLDSFYLQSTSQIDGLRHMRHPEHGFYGGVPDAAIAEGTPDLGIQLLAERGIVTRGVLLDMPRYLESVGRRLELDRNQAITAADLRGAAAFHGVVFRRGDVILLRTGWAEDWLGLTPAQQEARKADWGTPGIAQSHDVLELLWDEGIAMIASDNAGVEAFPVDPDSGFIDPEEPLPERGPIHNGMLHRPLLALLGIYLGELWRLDGLAEACAADGRFEFLLTSKPLAVPGGVGSPPNAMAVK
ncbi:cyclase family protein [Homoserinibacter sp. YIM 151385]|uniref:cyclase family protein n=1 Tax=Homoserinibacter sp. YIM 151385 TaxID=2985506 RepID=UPI0022F1390C|nr:cyclase family protein [Homoserinibacter sp. YIM 151385]WBU37081.1 cyclase family protein [Homoserinibacter sp. YIM 151385]